MKKTKSHSSKPETNFLQKALTDENVGERLKAVKRLRAAQSLVRVALESGDLVTSHAAIERISSPEGLAAIVGASTGYILRRAAAERLAALPRTAAGARALAAFRKEKALRAAVRDSANPAELAAFATGDAPWTVRAAALSRVEDPALLERVALTEPDAWLRFLAVSGVSKEAVLRKVAKSDADEEVRQLAGERLQALCPPKALPETAGEPKSGAAAEKDPEAEAKAASGAAPEEEADAEAAEEEEEDSFSELEEAKRAFLACLPGGAAPASATPDEEDGEDDDLPDIDDPVLKRAREAHRKAKAATEEERREARIQAKIAAAQASDDPAALADMARHDEEARVRQAATERVKNQKLLAEIAQDDNEASAVRCAAIERLRNQKVLLALAGDSDFDVAITASERVTGRKRLLKMARAAYYFEVQQVALQGLEAPEDFYAVLCAAWDYDAAVDAMEGWADCLPRPVSEADRRRLTEVALDHSVDAVRAWALESLPDKTGRDRMTIARVLLHDCDEACDRTLEWVEDQELCAEVAKVRKEHCDYDCRSHALENLTDPLMAAEVAEFAWKSGESAWCKQALGWLRVIAMRRKALEEAKGK